MRIPSGDGFNPSARIARRGDAEIDLTGREAELLALLVRRAGRVVSRDEALDAVWGDTRRPTTNTVDRYVAYLRTKLGEPSPIQTVRGVGFRLGR